MAAAAPGQKQMRDVSLPRTKTAAGELPPPDTKRWTARRKASVVGSGTALRSRKSVFPPEQGREMGGHHGCRMARQGDVNGKLQLRVWLPLPV